MFFQPRRLESLAFTAAVNDTKVHQVYEYIIPDFIVDEMWRDYLNSHRLSCAALLDYVEKTDDFNGALKCILKHNRYCEETMRFEWNLKSDIECCDADDYGLSAHMELNARYFNCIFNQLSKIDALRFVMIYMYALSESPQFMPESLLMVGFNIGGKCFDCDEDGVYDYDDVYYEMLTHETCVRNQFDTIKEINKLILNDRFRCECGTFLICELYTDCAPRLE
ncbi:hypothetical protein [Spodoptera cosmioides nucleopolyhedrovirus]|uniref:Uncharacterized protein n=1 Tax=Spodoptera cosmioides nucleopolyhedrovirus TaxID=2605774 RepID=A0A6B7KH95_9ABAC|nr:hypothetical protein [Spodoptera cosmioides nucleopolyhedrovirus]